MLKTYSSKIDKIMNEEIKTPNGQVATAAHAYPNPRVGDEGNEKGISVRNSETALGNLITDGMLEEVKAKGVDAVAAMQNGGGIRAGMDEGPITTGEIMTVLPFGNTLATMELTGTEIKEALEHSAANLGKDEKGNMRESGGFLHVSGMEYTYDSTKPAGERIQSVKIKRNDVFETLDNKKTYIIATNFFTAKGGDGYDVFAKAYEEGRVQDFGAADWENLRNHVIRLAEGNDGKVDVGIEGRIKDVASGSENE
ncbi:5'-nucleotidase [Virgibacillus sp. 179-BFC.A HS]|uniref:5'-nucleotidase n=1 Tax=Tigheibacillus jepli TaxID=3035914 RepID=A0ABU5CFD7_9BACI|nr:5'-nucleotidase [Virgibacillus sp. 179-BFC.A HS]MDY0404711.1 5'-nucleotidase [Virgibacillus sp. 179-BFC.A HS]